MLPNPGTLSETPPRFDWRATLVDSRQCTHPGPAPSTNRRGLLIHSDVARPGQRRYKQRMTVEPHPSEDPPPRLVDRVRERIRVKHYSLRTEQA